MRLAVISQALAQWIEAVAAAQSLNNDLKQAIARRRTPRPKATLKAEVTSHLRALQRRPAKVRSFVQAPPVRYAA